MNRITTIGVTSNNNWIIAGTNDGLIFGGQFDLNDGYNPDGNKNTDGNNNPDRNKKTFDILQDFSFTFDTNTNAPVKKILINHNDSIMVIIFDHAFFIYSIETGERLWSNMVSVDQISLTPDKKSIVYNFNIGTSKKFIIYEKMKLDGFDNLDPNTYFDKYQNDSSRCFFTCVNDDGSKILSCNSDGLVQIVNQISYN